MSIASNRSRRPNAGSKMNEVSGKEDDEFYKQAYGGFVEDDNDNEFEPENSDDEAVDDSIRENGESADLEDKEHPPAKRLKTEAKAGEDAESEEDVESDDDDDDDDDDEDDDDEDDEEEDEEEAEGAEEENGEDDDAEGEGEDEDDEEDSVDSDAKEKSKTDEPEAIPEKSEAE